MAPSRSRRFHFAPDSLAAPLGVGTNFRQTSATGNTTTATPRKNHLQAAICPWPGMSENTPASSSPRTLPRAPDMPYRVKARPSSWGSNMATMRRNAEGTRAAAETPQRARKTKKEYWSGRNESNKLRAARENMLYLKTGDGEYRSDTRPH